MIKNYGDIKKDRGVRLFYLKQSNQSTLVIKKFWKFVYGKKWCFLLIKIAIMISDTAYYQFLALKPK
jgi:hypothetical protein